jgi:Ti-type conjugative transfer relaxase TraA
MIPTARSERIRRAQLYVADATLCFWGRQCTATALSAAINVSKTIGKECLVVAVPHFSVSIVARGAGRSAVLSAAYRHCARMEFEREARVIDYTRKQGLLHEEFVVPDDAPDWLRSIIADRSVSAASEAFWNRVETFEKRADAQLAKDVTIALPVELSHDQNIALVRDFVAGQITARGVVADWVFHDAPGNPHVHLMTTLRPLSEDGFGAKKIAVSGPDGQPLRNDAGKIVYDLWAGSAQDFNAFRDGWFSCQNRHLALAGLDIRVDGRSFERQGIALTPTLHLGVGTKAIERKSDGEKRKVALERLELQQDRRAENARHIQRNPDVVLDLIAREKSVFDERDIAKVLYRSIDDAALFKTLMARILQSPKALRLDRERVDLATGARVPAKYTTRELIRLEAEMANRTIWLSLRAAHGVRNASLETVLARHARLSQEQRTAIAHVAGDERIAAVIGRAGAGKTTMMRAAREVWEAAGYQVVGGALAGKAAEGLETEAGIAARTLSSWELRWSQGRNRLNDQTVFVLDEAGMVSSRQMANLVETVVKAGAKLVLVGDPEQLQPIEAGAAFRAIANRIGYAELETIYRQHDQWMRDASLDLARGRIAIAVDAYGAHGKLVRSDLKADAVANLIKDWNRDYDPDRTSLILAHLRRDVRLLNDLARASLVERGLVEEGHTFKTENGVRRFAAGDQIVFLKNEGALGVRNGMLAKVVAASPGRLVVETGDGDRRRTVIVEERFYATLDHGYATTIHKSQGATVDRVKVLASLSLDRHLTYVAMTRHREDLAVYYGRRSFAKAGGLTEVLSRKNAKETTLDYANGRLYRQALRFAEARGLHLIHVARTLVRDRLDWMLRQKPTLLDLSQRLVAVGTRLRVAPPTASNHVMDPNREEKPMVSGRVTYPRSIEQSVEDRLVTDTALRQRWDEVSMRLGLVYARPDEALLAIDLTAMLRDKMIAEKTTAAIAAEPASFGALKGRTGLLANRTERDERERALANARPLADSISDYLRLRIDTSRRIEGEELAIRGQAALEIPALSANARAVLERVRDAIDRNDLPAGLEYALADRMVKAELDGFARAVAERFGERTFLSLAARDDNGKTFQSVTADLSAAQKEDVRQAWTMMRTAQQLLVHERSDAALKASEALRQTKSERLILK